MTFKHWMVIEMENNEEGDTVKGTVKYVERTKKDVVKFHILNKFKRYSFNNKQHNAYCHELKRTDDNRQGSKFTYGFRVQSVHFGSSHQQAELQPLHWSGPTANLPHHYIPFNIDSTSYLGTTKSFTVFHPKNYSSSLRRKRDAVSRLMLWSRSYREDQPTAAQISCSGTPLARVLDKAIHLVESAVIPRCEATQHTS